MTTPTTIPDDLIEAKEGSRLAKIHLSGLYRWIQKGKIRGWRRSGRVFVSRAEVLGLFKPMKAAEIETVPIQPKPESLAILRAHGML